MAKRIFLGAVVAAALAAGPPAAPAQPAQPEGGPGGSAAGQQQPAQGAAASQQHLQMAMRQAQAIAPVFSNPVTWRGEVPAGALGQNAPPATSQGVANCGPVAQGWFACDVTNRITASGMAGQGGTGSGQMGQMPSSPPMSWAGHMVVGYDPNANSYKAVIVDNRGTGLITYDGTLSGKKFALTSTAPIAMGGQMQKQRLSFDYTDPNNIQFTDERQSAGQQSWTMVERGALKPNTGAVTRQASTPSRR